MIMIKIGYASLLGVIAVSVFLGWRLSLPEKLPTLSSWRRRLLLLGLFGNAASLVGLLTVIATILTHSGLGDFRQFRILFPLSFVPIALGVFGRRTPRVLVIANGLVLIILWLDLAASSL
jgi:hypothetical protein